MDRRSWFFVGAGALSAVLTPIADAEHRWVAIALTITYLLFALASVLDARARDRIQPRRRNHQ